MSGARRAIAVRRHDVMLVSMTEAAACSRSPHFACHPATFGRAQ